MITWHKHHITPKHMGGTDDASNLLKCNVKMHAFLHYMLWKEHGKLGDVLASAGLLGLIGKEEMLAHRQKLAAEKRTGMKRKPFTEEHRARIAKAGVGKANNARQYMITNPDGNTSIITNLVKFCKDNNLKYSSMTAVSCGERKSAHGWKVSRI